MERLKNANVAHAYRIFLLVILPVLVGYFALPHTQTVDGMPLNAPSANPSAISNSMVYSFQTSAEMVESQKITTLFPLAGYLDFPPFVTHNGPLLCFEDNGSYLSFSNGTNQTPDFEWNVTLNNESAVRVGPNSYNCTAAKAGQDNNYNWYARINLPRGLNLSEVNVTFIPVTKTYPRIVMDYGLLQGLVLIPVAYLFIWYPAAGIIRKIKKGMEEQ